MKTKIAVEIHGYGEHSDYILKAVAAQNEGKADFSLAQLQAYLRVRDAMFKGCINDIGYLNENGNLDISRDGGKTFSLSLTWKEVHELKETNDDLKGIFPMDEVTSEIENELNKLP